MPDPTISQNPTPLLNERAAAAFLAVTPRCLQAWRWTGRGGLPFVRVGRRTIRYRREDLVAFVDSRLARSTSEPTAAEAEAAEGGE